MCIIRIYYIILKLHQSGLDACAGEKIVTGYITVGTNNLSEAVAFYDKLFAEMGAGRFMQEDRFVAWVVAPDQLGFSVCLQPEFTQGRFNVAGNNASTRSMTSRQSTMSLI